MASNFEHSVRYPFSTDVLWSKITSEQYWIDLIARTNGNLGKVDSFQLDGGTVTVTTTQGVAESELPSVITSVRPGNLEIPRTCIFSRSGDRITGHMKASVKGAPATVAGEIAIGGDPAVAVYRGSATVAIPFVGGKIEAAVIEQVELLLDAERDATVEFSEAE